MLFVDVVEEERYWYPDDGGEVWVAGYHLVDAEGRFLAREGAAARDLHVLSVAGAAQHHDHVLQGPGAAPGAPLELRRDRDNAHDPHAIAVLVAGGDQLGWVPREAAARLAERFDAGETFRAVVLRERRASPRDPRTGVTTLVAATASLDLRRRG